MPNPPLAAPRFPDAASAYISGILQGGPVFHTLKQILTSSLLPFGSIKGRWFALGFTAWFSLNDALSIIRRVRLEDPSKVEEAKRNISFLLDTALATIALSEVIEDYCPAWIAPIGMLVGGKIAQEITQRKLPERIFNNLNTWWNKPAPQAAAPMEAELERQHQIQPPG